MVRDLASNGKPRGPVKNTSVELTLPELPSVLHQIIQQNYKSIVQYLGRDFVHDETLLWRDFNFSESLSGYDLYSNVWHQDSHDGNRPEAFC